MSQRMFKTLRHIISQLPARHIGRKILVIESDDWGCWRTRDRKSLSLLSTSLPNVRDDKYNLLDTFETSEDLEALFDVLKVVRDRHGRHGIITANTIVANPDFFKIKQSGYQEYFYKTYEENLAVDPARQGVMTLIAQGMRENLYHPQLHGREHVNIRQWLNALRHGHRELLKAFQFEMFGIPLREKINMRNNVMAALDFDAESELKEQAEVIDDAQAIFQRLFGFRSISFIPPSYIWHPEIEHAFIRSGIKLVQGLPYQFIPNPQRPWYRREFRYTGKRSKSGISHSVRNAFFEPALNPSNDVVGECLNRISICFQLGRPAIVGSHRINFIGALEKSNRDRNLELLKKLLLAVVKRWPDVEFMSTEGLNMIINNEVKETP